MKTEKAKLSVHETMYMNQSITTTTNGHVISHNTSTDKMTNTEPLEKTLCLFTFLLALIVYSESHAVINFNSQVEDAQSFSMKNHRLAKRDATGDENCNSETQELENYLKSHKIDGEVYSLSFFSYI